MTPDLLVVCVAAFVAVFVLLTFLAVVMRLLLVAFPAPPPTDRTDAAFLAAVTSAVSAAFPDTRVTKIEEDR